MAAISSGDTAFVLVCAALVVIMTPGLAFFYGGLVHRTNVITIMMQSFISMGLVTAIWVIFGFTLAFGHDVGGVIGNFHYLFLRHVGAAPNAALAPHVPFLAFFVFQLTVAILTPALITGAFADRLPFKAYLKFLALWSVVVYIPFAHWIWGGGFLASWGVRDFGGGMPVHAAAGFSALASIFVIGKRRYTSGERTQPSNLPLVAIGAALLWFGWLGDNPGNAMAADGIATQAFVNTFIAGGLALFAWLLIDWARQGKPGMVGAVTGMLAGLVAVTPCAGFVPTWAAATIAVIAAVVCYFAVQLRARLGWDDALDVWGIHGVGGALGTVLLGVFALSSIGGVSGLLNGTGKQLGLQTLAIAIVIAYAFVATFVILKVLSAFEPLKVSDHVQTQGLDEELHGEAAYRLG